MRTVRVYLRHPLSTGATLNLEGDEAHYLRTVLRLERGAPLNVFNGDGPEFEAQITSVEKRRVTIAIASCIEPADDSRSLSLELGLGISRGERMDWAIQKATELGVTAICPLLLERCNAKLDAKRTESRLRHWEQVVISACEQSGRRTLPTIAPPVELSQWLVNRQTSLGLVLDPHGDGLLPSAQQAPSSVSVLIGPEGGLSTSEVTLALSHGFRRWALGPRILRTETAPAAALAILQYQWGDMGTT